jgi:hypothetical protein
MKLLNVVEPVDCKIGKNLYSDVLLLETDTGVISLALDADCCSASYFEEQSVLDLKALVGQELVSIEHTESRKEDVDNDVCVTKYHALLVRTDKESITVDWRNESNGYYDGSCDIYVDGKRHECSRFAPRFSLGFDSTWVAE